MSPASVTMLKPGINIFPPGPPRTARTLRCFGTNASNSGTMMPADVSYTLCANPRSETCRLTRIDTLFASFNWLDNRHDRLIDTHYRIAHPSFPTDSHESRNQKRAKRRGATACNTCKELNHHQLL